MKLTKVVVKQFEQDLGPEDHYWTVDGDRVIKEMKYDPELCNALWGAVKEVLRSDQRAEQA